MSKLLRITLTHTPEQFQRLCVLQAEFARVCNALAPMVRDAALAASLPEGDPARAEAVLAAESAMRDALRLAPHGIGLVCGSVCDEIPPRDERALSRQPLYRDG